MLLALAAIIASAILAAAEVKTESVRTILEGCYPEEKIVSILDGDNGMYDEGTSRCLSESGTSDSGTVITDEHIKMRLITPQRLDKYETRTKWLVVKHDSQTEFSTEYKVSPAALEYIGNSDERRYIEGVEIALAPTRTIDNPAAVTNAFDDGGDQPQIIQVRAGRAGGGRGGSYRGGGAYRSGGVRTAAYRGGAVYRGGAYRGGAVVRGGAAVGGYGGGYCDPYYQNCGGGYYTGGGVYRGGAAVVRGGGVYRGGAAYRGSAAYGGGRGAHVAHRGGGRRR